MTTSYSYRDRTKKEIAWRKLIKEVEQPGKKICVCYLILAPSCCCRVDEDTPHSTMFLFVQLSDVKKIL